jgi:hypothetical protein
VSTPQREGEPAEKLCGKCNKILPVDKFSIDKSVPGGRRYRCGDCDAKTRTGRQAWRNSLEAKVSKLDKLVAKQEVTMEAVELIGDIAKRASMDKKSRASLPHLSTTYEALMRHFDGAEGFALATKIQYDASQPGSTQRNKILEMIYHMAKTCSAEGYVQKPHELMTTEELEAEWEKQQRALLEELGIVDEDGNARSA